MAANPLWQRIESVARLRRDTPAVLCGGAALSYAELHAAATRLAGRTGLRPGDRVLIAAANQAALLPWIAAIWRAGAIPVMVHADAPPAHLAHAAAVTEPVLALAGPGVALPAHLPAIAPALPEPGPDAPLAPGRRHGSDPASVVFTSGSTGLPKGVTQAATTLIDGADRIGGMLGYRAGDRILCPIPFAFDYGWGQVMTCLLGGITLVLPEEASAFGLCAALDRHRPTVLAGVPSVFADLFSGLSPIAAADCASVRLVTTTGSRVPLALFEALCGRFPDAALSLNYGLTETYRSASLPPALARAHPDAVGEAVPGVTLSVLGADGRPAAPEEEGEIVHRGAGTFLGYWGDPQRTAQVLRADPSGGAGSTVFTGDLGRIGRNGLLYVHGRRDRQMKCMGVRVSPDEIERILSADGDVAEAAVVALDHDVFGQLIVACIRPCGDPAGAPPVAAPGETALAAPPAEARALLKRLKALSRSRMSPFMQPRRWEIFATLPRTRSGKVDYPALKALVEMRS